MLRFKTFITEAKLSGTGSEASRHANKYITPYVGSAEPTHMIASEHENLHAGDQVHVHGYEVDSDTGKHYAHVSKTGKKEDAVKVPFSKLNKPVASKPSINKGLEFETKVVHKLNHHGLMHGGGAGFTGGNDFHLVNKKKHNTIHGKMAETAIQGEAKKDLSAAFGQASLTHHPDKGWHFSEKTKQKFPEYTSAIEHASVTVNGQKKPLIKHINDTYQAPSRDKKTSANVYSDTTDLHPMHSYLRDHSVDVLHVGSHGTFRAGHSEKENKSGLSLPVAHGEGRFRVRQKHPTSLTVQFNVKKLNKSDTNIENDTHLAKIKKELGHE